MVCHEENREFVGKSGSSGLTFFLHVRFREDKSTAEIHGVSLQSMHCGINQFETKEPKCFQWQPVAYHVLIQSCKRALPTLQCHGRFDSRLRSEFH